MPRGRPSVGSRHDHSPSAQAAPQRPGPSGGAAGRLSESTADSHVWTNKWARKTDKSELVSFRHHVSKLALASVVGSRNTENSYPRGGHPPGTLQKPFLEGTINGSPNYEKSHVAREM